MLGATMIAFFSDMHETAVFQVLLIFVFGIVLWNFQLFLLWL